MKVCKQCEEPKVETDFAVHPPSKGGRARICKLCKADNVRGYNRTVIGKAKRLWLGICDRAENKRGDLPTYQNVKLLITKPDFLSWVIPLLEKWPSPLCGTKESPTVDRIDSSKDYSLDNLQVVSRSENSHRHGENYKAPKDMAWCSQCKTFLNKTFFWVDRRAALGVTSTCKTCKQQV